MSLIKIVNPDETLKKWEDIRKRLHDIWGEIEKLETTINTGGAEQDGGEGIYIEIANKDEFLEVVEAANYHIGQAKHQLNWRCPEIKARIKEEGKEE